MGEHSARPNGEGQIRARQPIVHQGKLTLGADSAGVNVDPLELKTIGQESKLGLGAGRAVIALSSKGYRAIGTINAPSEAHVQLGGLDGHVRQGHGGQIGVKVELRLADHPCQGAFAHRLTVNLDGTDIERPVGLPAQAEVDRAVQLPLALGFGPSLGPLQRDLVEGHSVADKSGVSDHARFGA